ncbi:GxxExxY protein, partial [Candidatus Dependentiae bacterium]|nr:GxxExxY protein [Candidatus Dependentiae bacterium]
KTGLHAESQYPITVYYDNDEIIGEFRADIYVENTVIVELKSVIHIVKEFEVKLVNHLVSTKKDVGVLINFGEKQVEVKRKVRFLNSQDKI